MTNKHDYEKTLNVILTTDKRPYSEYHDAASCWKLIEFMIANWPRWTKEEIDKAKLKGDELYRRMLAVCDRPEE